MEAILLFCIWIIPPVMVFIAAYFVIKAAVKNGVKAALAEVADEKDAVSWSKGAAE